MVHISKGNKKLGFIPSVSTPAGLTCRLDCACAKGCYAKKNTFNFDNVKSASLKNYQSYKENSDNYFNEIIAFLNNRNIIYKRFRWSVSGDLIDYKYLLGVIRVANATKYTKHLVFTKKFDLVNLYLSLGHKLPKNLKIVFSHWDKTFESKVINDYNLPSAYVNFKDKSKNVKYSRYAHICPGSCENCSYCWNMREGQQVVFNEH